MIKRKGRYEQGKDDGPPKQDPGNAFGGRHEKAKKE